MNDKSYRKNVGLIVLDQNNQLLICRRKGKKTWQFPQKRLNLHAGANSGKQGNLESYW